MRSAKKLYSRCAELIELRAGLRELRREITFCGSPLSTAVLKVRARGVFADFTAALQTTGEPTAAWQKVEKNLSANEQQRQALGRFFASLGKGDMALQEREFERVDVELSEAIEESSAKAKNGGKLRSTLGVLTGVAVIILMM